MASALLSDDECRRAVEASLHTADFDVVNVSAVPRSEYMLGFLGEHWTVEIGVHLRHDHTSSRPTKLTLFVKSTPQRSASQKQLVTAAGLFEKETGLYSKLLPTFDQILTSAAIEHGVTTAEQTKRRSISCRCYLTRPDLLVLEDLSLLGFSPLNSRVPLDLKHCSAMLQTLARFHAASIVFEERRRQMSEPVCSINQLYSELVAESPYSSRETPSKDWFLKSVDVVETVAKSLPKYSDVKNYSFIEQKIPPQCREIWNLVKPSEKYRNVLCHGDLWSSNILVSYNEDDSEHETPTGVRLVDFQYSRYAPPAHDVMCFLYLTTTRAIREIHEHDLLRLYHGALGAELACHGLDCEQLLPWSEFQESCCEQRLAGMVAAAVYFPSILSDNPIHISETHEMFDSFVLVDRSDMVKLELQRNPVMKARMTDVIEELVEYALKC